MLPVWGLNSALKKNRWVVLQDCQRKMCTCQTFVLSLCADSNRCRIGGLKGL